MLDLFWTMQVSYEKPLIVSFKRKLESVPYNANLVITGAIRRTFRERLHHELGFHKIVKRFSPVCHQEILSSCHVQYYHTRAKSAENIE